MRMDVECFKYLPVQVPLLSFFLSFFLSIFPSRAFFPSSEQVKERHL